MKPWEKYQNTESSSGPWEKYGQQQDQSDVASTDQYLSMGERATTGFRVNPEEYLEQRRAQMGLAPGTPLEPTPETASLMENLKDIPGDIVDMLGPAFPAVGQMIGGALAGAASIPTTGGTALPAAVAAGGVGGAIGGEVARQAVGEFLKLEDQDLSERAKRVALEGVYGVAGEAAYLGGSMALKATKKGLIKAGEKLLSQKGLEGFVKGFSRITRNLGPDEFTHALNSLRQGDDSVIKKSFASKDFGDKFTKELFFGEKIGAGGKIVKKGNVARQIRNLASKTDAREPIKQLYKEFLNVSDETFDMAVKYGSNIEQFGNKNIVKEIKLINRRVPKMFDDLGQSLGKARTKLANKVPGADVSNYLTATNSQLASGLSEIGLLREIAPGSYEIASDYITTAKGRSQVNSFVRYIDKFFSKSKEFGKMNMAMLEKAIIEGDEAAVKSITRGKFFTPKVNMKFGDFAKSMKSLEAQISGKDFYEMGKLSPNLTTFVQGLRGVTEKVADEYGDIAVKSLSTQYRALAESAELLRDGSKVKTQTELSKVLSKYINPQDPIEQQTASNLERFLKSNVGTDVFEKIRGFKALENLKGLETDLTRTEGRQAFVNMMKNAFSENTSVKRDLIENSIDPYLPNHLKISLNSKNHTTAVALQSDALSILKARFLSSGVGIPALLGGATGGYLGGYKGATLGLGAGIGLQNPKLLIKLLKMTSKAPAQRALNIPIKELSRTQTIGGVQALQALLSQNQ